MFNTFKIILSAKYFQQKKKKEKFNSFLFCQHLKTHCNKSSFSCITNTFSSERLEKIVSLTNLMKINLSVLASSQRDMI